MKRAPRRQLHFSSRMVSRQWPPLEGCPLSIPEGPHGQTALQICPRSFTLRASRRPPEEAKDEVLGRQIVQLSRFDAGI